MTDPRWDLVAAAPPAPQWFQPQVGPQPEAPAEPKTDDENMKKLYDTISDAIASGTAPQHVHRIDSETIPSHPAFSGLDEETISELVGWAKTVERYLDEANGYLQMRERERLLQWPVFWARRQEAEAKRSWSKEVLSPPQAAKK